MSIEALLKELTEAVRENTAALQGGGGGESTKASSGKSSSGKASGKGKTKEITVDVIAEKAGEFLGTGSAAQKKKAIAAMKKLNAHFGVKKITDSDEDDYAEVVEKLDMLIAGEDPFEDGEEEGGEEEALV